MTAPAVLSRGKTNGKAPVPAETPAPTRHLELLRVDQVDVGANVRVEPGELDELAASIKEHGVLQPVRVVGPHKDGRYRLVWGQRRLLAARQAGLEFIHAIVDSLTAAADVDEAGATRSIEQLVENLHRADLNPIDEARALREVLDADKTLTQVALATKLGRSAPWVSNALRLLGLDEKVQAKLAAGEISQSHGKAIASLPAKQQREVAQRIVSDKVSAKELERTLEWKRQEAENEEAAAKRTARMLPKMLAALVDAGVKKGDTVFLTAAYYSFDVDGLRKQLSKAGYKSSDTYVRDAPPKGCDCKGTYRLDVDGRAAKVQRACAKDHWRRAHDRELNAQRQDDAKAQKEHRAKIAAAAVELGKIAVPVPLKRVLVNALSRYSYPQVPWAQTADPAKADEAWTRELERALTQLSSDALGELVAAPPIEPEEVPA